MGDKHPSRYPSLASPAGLTPSGQVAAAPPEPRLVALARPGHGQFAPRNA